MRRRLIATGAAVLVVLALGTVGCAEGKLQENAANGDDSNQVANDNTGQNTDSNGDDNQNTGQNDNQNGGDNDGDPKPTGGADEAHQLCAAAGETSNGRAEALHCFAPHDVSGFEATSGERTWKPGAFQVVAE